MAKRIMAKGRVINGKLFSTGDPIEPTPEQEKELDELGVLAPKPAKAEPAPAPSKTGKAAGAKE